jgi:hypothetical protein
MLLLLGTVTITDSNIFERVPRQFVALCHKRFLQDMEYYYDIKLEKLNLLTLHIRRRHFDALFLINAFSVTVLEIVGSSYPKHT